MENQGLFTMKKCRKEPVKSICAKYKRKSISGERKNQSQAADFRSPEYSS